MIWLDELQAGDKVILNDAIKTVARTTKTLICIEPFRKFWRKNGREVGLSVSYIEQYTEDAENKKSNKGE